MIWLIYHPHIFLRHPGKKTKTLFKNCDCPAQYMNRTPPKKKSDALSLKPVCSINCGSVLGYPNMFRVFFPWAYSGEYQRETLELQHDRLVHVCCLPTIHNYSPSIFEGIQLQTITRLTRVGRCPAPISAEKPGVFLVSRRHSRKSLGQYLEVDHIHLFLYFFTHIYRSPYHAFM